MSGRIDDYLHELEAQLRADAAHKRQILDELRTHIDDKLADMRAEQPEADHETLVAEVLAEFGPARELALAYEPNGTVAVLQNRAGEVLLHIGDLVERGATYVATDLGPRAARGVRTHGPPAARAVGRVTGRFLRFLGITIVVLLVLSLALGIFAFYELRPLALTIADEAAPAYSHTQDCRQGACPFSVTRDTFYVEPGDKTVRLTLGASPDRDAAQMGNVTFRIYDPQGGEHFNRTFGGSQLAHSHVQTQWEARPGDWMVEIVVDHFSGFIDLDLYARSVNVPWE